MASIRLQKTAHRVLSERHLQWLPDFPAAHTRRALKTALFQAVSLPRHEILPRVRPAAMAALGVLLALALHAPAAQAEIYKWVDAEGKVHFSDKKPRQGKASKVDLPPVNTIQQVTVKRPLPGAAASPAANGEVVMYSASWCGVCTVARRYFERNGVRFSEYDVETTEKGRRDYAVHKGRGVPLIFVGAARMEGFSEGRFRQMQAGR